MNANKKILVAPLNWGLGHASRCVPLIRELQRQGVQVVLASDGDALALLQDEFPELPAYELPAYGIRYHGGNMVLDLGRQLPVLMTAIYQENRRTGELIKVLGLDGIVSDNRYGCFSRHIPCAFVSHQINIRIPVPGLAGAVNLLHRQLIRRFDEVWVPDLPGERNLSGELSHGPGYRGFRYIGALSRMRMLPEPLCYDGIAVLSGPEPQRSRLEELLLAQMTTLPHRFLLVQGKTRESSRSLLKENVEVASCLGSSELNRAIMAARLFIGRSGYSTIMDLAKLRKPALLIPTPGQTEQEYLARLLDASGLFTIQSQDKLDLPLAMSIAGSRPGLPRDYSDPAALEATVGNWLARLGK
ncbi:MAG: hypothetical protein RI973_82 [Bacteroidota bacterium]